MLATVNVPKQIKINFVQITFPVRASDGIPADFPMRTGNTWSAFVKIDSGEIVNWPTGKSGEIYEKVRDSGSYALITEEGERFELYQEYVPHGVVPGEYGDYVELKIDETGRITNWPKDPDVSEFFEREE